MRLEAVLRALKSKRAKKADRMARYRLLAARSDGASLRNLAGLLGIHVSTLCRWQLRHPVIKAALDEAAPRRAKAVKGERPSVNVHGACPLCKARSVVRKAGTVPFWRCARWPSCRWSSWRPRHPRNCPRCKGPRYWSHSRRSVVCEPCGLRTERPLSSAQLYPFFRLKPLAFVSRTRGFRGECLPKRGKHPHSRARCALRAPPSHCRIRFRGIGLRQMNLERRRPNPDDLGRIAACDASHARIIRLFFRTTGRGDFRAL